MNIKSERFELRLDPETLNRVDAWRNNQDDTLTRAEAIRRLIDRGIMGSTKDNFALGHTDRLIVWLLTELLRTSGNDGVDKRSVHLIQEAIYGGHYWALPWEMTGIFHTYADSPKDVGFVTDVLNMWRSIERSLAKLSEDERKRIEEGADGTLPKFIGFDGNNESALMSITRFMIHELGRFSEFKDRDLNSHMPMRNRYALMNALFKSIHPNLVGRDLSPDELTTLLTR